MKEAQERRAKKEEDLIDIKHFSMLCYFSSLSPSLSPILLFILLG